MNETAEEIEQALIGCLLLDFTTARAETADYALTPGRYVGAAPLDDDGEPIDQKIERLTTELFAQFDESARLQAVVREQLGRVK